jgi:hypothetical protein
LFALDRSKYVFSSAVCSHTTSSIIVQHYFSSVVFLASYCVKDNAFVYVFFRLHNLFWYKYTTCIFLTTCFGLMGPSSGAFRLLYNRHFFCYSPPHWPVSTHWECVAYVLFVCPFLPSMLFSVKSLNLCIVPRVKLVKIGWLKYTFGQILQSY